MAYTVKNNVQELLNKKNKSPYWLSKEANISLPAVYSLVKNSTESIKFDIMARIVIALECSLDELFTIIKEEDNNKEEERQQ